MIIIGNPSPFGFKPFGSFDASRFAFFGTSGFAGNTPQQWQDESGNGNHLFNTDADDRFALVADSGGRTVYRSSQETGGLFKLPNISPTPSDYTIYMVLRPAEVGNVYLLDGAGHSLGLGINASDFGAYYYAATARGSVSVAAGELVVLVWRLQAAVGGRVYKNNDLVYTGPYAKNAFNPVTTLGHDFSAYYAPFIGDILGFGIVLGNDTDSQVIETRAHLANKSLLTL